VSALNAAQSTWPGHIDLRLLEILYLEKLGDRRRIVFKLSQLVELAPGHPQVQQLIGRYPDALEASSTP
jgi:hypothetical protein